MKALLVGILIFCLASPALADDPCKDANARPAGCKPPASWLCLSPELAASMATEPERIRRDCRLRAEATQRETDTVLRRELGKKDAELDRLRARYVVSLDVLADAEEARDEAVDEADSRWSTGELVAWVGGAFLVGAAGGVAAWYWSK